MEMEGQQALGTVGLLDEDCHLGECNLKDLKDTSGIKKTCLLAPGNQGCMGGLQAGSTTKTDDCSRINHQLRGCLLHSKQQLYVCVAMLTQVKVLEGYLPSLVVPTAMLFGLVPLAYEDFYYG